MRDQAEELSRLVRNGFDVEAFGRVIHDGWELKRGLASTITSDKIDGWYKAARQAGAYGGKLCGAGGGGFILLVSPPERHTAIREALGNLTEIQIDYEPRGTRLMFPGME
jgi:D-glycero-alpha-D-manno-heptose-7-phosphate kinase